MVESAFVASAARLGYGATLIWPVTLCGSAKKRTVSLHVDYQSNLHNIWPTGLVPEAPFAKEAVNGNWATRNRPEMVDEATRRKSGDCTAR